MRKQHKKMSALDQEVQAWLERMRDDMTLKEKSATTRSCYSEAVRLLAKHYEKSPADLGEEQIREYLLYLVNERELAPSTVNQKFFGIRFFYRETLDTDFSILGEFKLRTRENRIPVCLTHEEVQRVLAAVRSDEYRTVLTLIYSCGLRITEACTLRVDNVLTGQGKLLVRGKNGTQRSMPLPNRTLELLRENYRESRPPRPWMFGNGRNTDHIQQCSIQRVLKKAVRASGVNGAATVHTLRHSYATTLLLRGIDITTVQKWLGHSDITTTLVYLHVVEQAMGDYVEILNETMSDL